MVTEHLTVIRKNGQELYNITAQRDESVYPSTPIGREAFRQAVKRGEVNLTTDDGCTIPVGVVPPVQEPDCSSSGQIGPLWASAKYSDDGTTFTLLVKGEDMQIKFERQDGQGFTLSNPDGVTINSGQYYGYGPVSGDYNKRWQILGLHNIPIKITLKRSSDNATFAYSFTPVPGVTNAQLFTASANVCDFAVSVANKTIAPGGTAVLTAVLSGTNTSGVTFSWSNGQTTASISVTPNVTTAYTVTATKTGCSSKSATGSVLVSSPGTALSKPGYGGMLADNSTYVAMPESNRPSLNQKFPRGFLQRGGVKIGINVKLGSIVDFLTFDNGLTNIVNSPIWPGNEKDDAGRQLMDSCYMSPNGQVNPAHPEWVQGPYIEDGQSTDQYHGGPGNPSIGWNGVQGGSYGQDPTYGKTLVYYNDDELMYHKAQPAQWDMSGIWAKMYMEGWIRFMTDRAIHRHTRWTMFRDDAYATNYQTPTQQETPCFYITPDYKQVYYVAGQPWTNSPLIEYPYDEATENPITPFIIASEPWLMIKNRNTGRFVILISTNARWGVGGFNNERLTTNEPTSFKANYIACLRMMTIDPNDERGYDFDSIVFEGTESECRNFVNSLTRLKDTLWTGLPEYVFNQRSRLGCFLHNAKDQGEKNMTQFISIKPMLNNENAGRDYNFSLPEVWVNGRTVKKLYVRLAVTSSDGAMWLRWQKPGLVDGPEYYHEFNVTANGQFQTVEINLTGVSNWDGSDIIAPVIRKRNNNAVISNEEIKIEYISYRNLG